MGNKYYQRYPCLKLRRPSTNRFARHLSLIIETNRIVTSRSKCVRLLIIVICLKTRRKLTKQWENTNCKNSPDSKCKYFASGSVWDRLTNSQAANLIRKPQNISRSSWNFDYRSVEFNNIILLKLWKSTDFTSPENEKIISKFHLQSEMCICRQSRNKFSATVQWNECIKVYGNEALTKWMLPM